MHEYRAMTTFQIIRATDCPEVPWKNGGGTTREIAVFPPDAGMDTFLWRLSMAKVETAGPFSAFTGIDRVLAVLDGTLVLTGPNLDVRLDAGTPPQPFDGGAAVFGEPLGGPVLDLNAMARRGRFTCAMTRLDAGSTATAQGTGFVIALEPQPLAETTLERLDCVRFEGALAIGGRVLFVDFRDTCAEPADTPH